jgi:hypothetical protein
MRRLTMEISVETNILTGQIASSTVPSRSPASQLDDSPAPESQAFGGDLRARAAQYGSTLGLAVLLALGAGCAPEADTPLGISSPGDGAALKIGGNGRFSVVRVGVIKDDLAYHDRRGIYLIKDNVTGKEFVGLSGVGVSELGSHSSGKTTISDER